MHTVLQIIAQLYPNDVFEGNNSNLAGVGKVMIDQIKEDQDTQQRKGLGCFMMYP